MNSPGTKEARPRPRRRASDAVIAGLAPMNDPAGRRHAPRHQPAGGARGLQRGHLERAQAVPRRGRQPDQRRPRPQALGLIATVSAREALSQEYALLSGMLVAHRESQADRAAFAEMAATRQGDVVDADYVLDPANLAIFNKQAEQLVPDGPHRLEEAIVAGIPVAKLPITAGRSGRAGGPGCSTGYFTGGVERRERPAGGRPPDQPVGVDHGSPSPPASACSGCSSPSR